MGAPRTTEGRRQGCCRSVRTRRTAPRFRLAVVLGTGILAAAMALLPLQRTYAAADTAEETAAVTTAVQAERTGKSSPAAEFSSYTNADTGYGAIIADTADLMTDAEEQALLETMQEMTAFGNAYCYTTDDDVRDTYDYAGDRYEEEFGTAPGSIFLIAMGSRQLYLYNEGSVKDIITSSVATSIVDAHYTLASDGDYAGCAAAVFTDVCRTLSGRLLFQPLRIITVLLLSILIAVLINYCVMVLGRHRAERLGDNLSVLDSTTESARGIGAVSLAAAIAAFAITSRRRYHINHNSGSSGGQGGGGGGGFSGGGGHSGSGGGHGF